MILSRKISVLIVLFAALATFQSLYADALYWLVTDVIDKTVSVRSETGMTSADINAVRVVVRQEGSDSSTALTSYAAPDDGGYFEAEYFAVDSTYGTINGTKDGMALMVDLSSYASSEYAFAIELGNANTGGWTTLADSGYWNYDWLESYISEGGLSTQGMTAWTPSAYAAPEPTSGLLFLTGLSLMALRRRKVV